MLRVCTIGSSTEEKNRKTGLRNSQDENINPVNPVILSQYIRALSGLWTRPCVGFGLEDDLPFNCVVPGDFSGHQALHRHLDRGLYLEGQVHRAEGVLVAVADAVEEVAPVAVHAFVVGHFEALALFAGALGGNEDDSVRLALQGEGAVPILLTEQRSLSSLGVFLSSCHMKHKNTGQ